MASVPVPATRWYLRDMWEGAVERAGLKALHLSDLRRLRGKLLKANRPTIRLLSPSTDVPTTRANCDLTREAAQALLEVLPFLALTVDEGRRLLLRRVPD